jgi:hypothetical protein
MTVPPSNTYHGSTHLEEDILCGAVSPRCSILHNASKNRRALARVFLMQAALLRPPLAIVYANESKTVQSQSGLILPRSVFDGAATLAAGNLAITDVPKAVAKHVVFIDDHGDAPSCRK